MQLVVTSTQWGSSVELCLTYLTRCGVAMFINYFSGVVLTMVRVLGRLGGISSVFILWLSKILQWYVNGVVIVPYTRREV